METKIARINMLRNPRDLNKPQYRVLKVSFVLERKLLGAIFHTARREAELNVPANRNFLNAGFVVTLAYSIREVLNLDSIG